MSRGPRPSFTTTYLDLDLERRDRGLRGNVQLEVVALQRLDGDVQHGVAGCVSRRSSASEHQKLCRGSRPGGRGRWVDGAVRPGTQGHRSRAYLCVGKCGGDVRGWTGQDGGVAGVRLGPKGDDGNMPVGCRRRMISSGPLGHCVHHAREGKGRGKRHSACVSFWAWPQQREEKGGCPGGRARASAHPRRKARDTPSQQKQRTTPPLLPPPLCNTLH